MKPPFSHTFDERVLEVVHPRAGLGRNPDGLDRPVAMSFDSRLSVRLIDLVVDLELFNPRSPDLAQNILDNGLVAASIGACTVDQVDDQRRAQRLLEGGAKRCDELMGKITNETDRIAHQDGTARQPLDASNGWIQGREQLVARHDAGFGQAVEKRTLSRIGVADERDQRNLVAITGSATLRPALLDLIKALGQCPDSASEETAIRFQLGLTWPTETDPAPLALKMGPAAHEARREMTELSKLDLQLALMRPGSLGEDVKDQGRAIKDIHLEVPDEIALLDRTQPGVNKNKTHRFLLYLFGNLVDLARSDEILWIRLIAGSPELGDDIEASRFSQSKKFFPRIRVIGNIDDGMKEERARCLAGTAMGNVSGFDFDQDSELASSSCSRTLRAGTTVEIACL